MGLRSEIEALTRTLDFEEGEQVMCAAYGSIVGLEAETRQGIMFLTNLRAGVFAKGFMFVSEDNWRYVGYKRISSCALNNRTLSFDEERRLAVVCPDGDATHELSAIEEYFQNRLDNYLHNTHLEAHNSGWGLLEEGDFHTALSRARSILDSRPNSVDGLVLASFAYKSLEDYAAAKSLFERALQTTAGVSWEATDLRNQLAHVSLLDGDFESSMKYANDLIDTAPGDLRGLYMRALARWNMGKRDGARRDVQELVSRDVDHGDALRWTPLSRQKVG